MTPPTEPEGWKPLPAEMTREMWAAGADAALKWGACADHHHDVVVGAIYAAVYEAAPPAPVEPMRKALSDEELTQLDLSPATEAEKRRTRELVENGEIAIASGEVAGLIREGRSWASPRNISRDMAAAKQLITRLVDALEGRL